MWTDLLVFGLVIILVVIFVVKRTDFQTIGRRILTWVDLPNDDAVAPWRVRLVLLVLLYPAISALIGLLSHARHVVELVVGGALTDFGQSVFTCLETVGVSLQTSAWPGLIAYGVLRRSSPKKVRLIVWVIGYWTLAYVVQSLLLANWSPTTLNSSLGFAAVFFALCTVVMLLVTCWFWLAAKATRTMLVIAGEENGSTGLSLRNMICVVSGLGLLMLGFRIISDVAQSTGYLIDLRFEAILLGPVFSSILVALLMATVFLTRSNLQLLIGIAILVLLDAIQWIARDMLERMQADPEIGGVLLRESSPVELLLGFVSIFVQAAALLGLKWLWLKIGLKFSVGTRSTMRIR